MAFNITAQLVLAGPNNITTTVKQLRTQLGSLAIPIKFTIPAGINNSVNSLTKNIGGLNTSLHNLPKSVTAANQALTQLQTTLAKFGASGNTKITISQNLTSGAHSAKVMTGEMEKLGIATAQSIKRFAGMSIGAGAIFGMVRATTEAVKEALDFQNQLVKLSQLTGQSVSSFGALTNTITKLSVGLGVSSKELMSVTQLLVQAGMSTGEVQISLEALAKTATIPSFGSMADTVEAIIPLMHEFKLQATDLEGVFGDMAALSAKFAVSSHDLIDVIRRTGATFAAASEGIGTPKEQLNQLMSTFVAVRGTTRQSAESISTGLNTIFARMQRPAVLEELRQLGLNLTDLEGKFVGPYEAVNRLGAALKNMNPRSTVFAQIIEQVGGYRQIRTLIPELLQVETRMNALKVAGEGTATMDEMVAKSGESLERQFTKVHEQFLALIRDISNTGTFQTIVTLILKLAEGFLTAANAIKPIIPLLAIVMGARGAIAMGGFMRGAIGNFKGHASGGVAGYARGGLVPGSGDGDTVPAMLEAGEFVMKKSAVNAVGADSLHQMNGYAFGGNVDLDNPITKGYITGNINKNIRTGSKLPTTMEQMQKFPHYGGVFINPRDSKEDSIPKTSGNDFHYLFTGAGLPKGTADNMEQKIIKPKILGAINLSAKAIGQEFSVTRQALPNDEDGKKFIPNMNGIIGGIFEGALLSLGAPFDNSGGISHERRMDFPNGIGSKLAGIFGMPALAYLPTDAKKTKDMKAFGEKFRGAYLESRAPHASGGAIGDSVPAMLTPGEFVINRNSAQRIGYDSLHKLNAQGYAAGGFVGPVSNGMVGNSMTVRGISGGMTPQMQMSIEKVVKDMLDWGASIKNATAAGNKYAKILSETGNHADALSRAHELLQRAETNQAKGTLLGGKGGLGSKISNFAQSNVAGFGLMTATSIMGAVGNQKDPTMAGVTGGFGGAAAGAEIGRMAGPWGMAAGAVVGAGYGAITAYRDAAANNAQEAADKSLVEATKQLDDAFSKFGGNIEKISNAAGAMQAASMEQNKADIVKQNSQFLGKNVSNISELDRADASNLGHTRWINMFAPEEQVIQQNLGDAISARGDKFRKNREPFTVRGGESLNRQFANKSYEDVMKNPDNKLYKESIIMSQGNNTQIADYQKLLAKNSAGKTNPKDLADVMGKTIQEFLKLTPTLEKAEKEQAAAIYKLGEFERTTEAAGKIMQIWATTIEKSTSMIARIEKEGGQAQKLQGARYETLAGGSQAISGWVNKNPFENPAASSQAELLASSKKLGLRSDQTSMILASAKIKGGGLNDIISQEWKKPAISDEGHMGVIPKIMEELRGIPKDIATGIENQLRASFAGNATDVGGKKTPEKFNEALQHANGLLAEATANAAKKQDLLNQTNTKAIEILNKELNIRQTYIGQLAGEAGRTSQAQIGLKEMGGKYVGYQERLQPFQAQQSSIQDSFNKAINATGMGGIKGKELPEQLALLQKAMEVQSQKMKDKNWSGIDIANSDEIKNLGMAAASVAKEMNLLKDDTTRLAAAQQRLNEIESERKSVQGGLMDLATANPMQRAMKFQGLALAVAGGGGGQLGANQLGAANQGMGLMEALIGKRAHGQEILNVMGGNIQKSIPVANTYAGGIATQAQGFGPEEKTILSKVTKDMEEQTKTIAAIDFKAFTDSILGINANLGALATQQGQLGQLNQMDFAPDGLIAMNKLSDSIASLKDAKIHHEMKPIDIILHNDAISEKDSQVVFAYIQPRIQTMVDVATGRIGNKMEIA